MAKTQKYIRKSGATTIKHNGKIVGNIGQGKTKNPTATKTNTTPPNTSHTNKTTTPTMTEETITILWEITKNQPFEKRMTLLANLATHNNKKTIHNFYNNHILNNAVDTHSEKYFELYLLAKQTKNHRILDLLITASAGSISGHATQNENISQETLHHMSKHQDPNIRQKVINHPNTTLQTFIHLTKDKSVKLRRNMAYNTHTPPQILEILSKDKDHTVRCNVAHNNNTPTKVLEKLKTEDTEDNVRREASTNLHLNKN